MSGRVIKVSGPLVVAEGLADANVSDVVRVGSQRLIGEILNMSGDKASIQVYEETSGLGPGAQVDTMGTPLSVELGPGLLENIYDGIQRPLTEIRELTGHTIARGVDVPALNRTKQWEFTAVVQAGTRVVPGDILGTVQETSAILHKIMVPVGVSGTVLSIQSGSYTVLDVVAKIKCDDGTERRLTMMQKWPVRVNRGYNKRSFPTGRSTADSVL
jgi:V/A-type H+-transporting ATPase subunit A